MNKSSYQRIKGDFSSHTPVSICAYTNGYLRIVEQCKRIKGNINSPAGHVYRGVWAATYIIYPIKIYLHILIATFCGLRGQKPAQKPVQFTSLVDALSVGLTTNDVNQKKVESNNLRTLDDCINCLTSSGQTPCWTPVSGRASPLVALLNLDDLSTQRFTPRSFGAAHDPRVLRLRSRPMGPEPAAALRSVLVAEQSLDVTLKTRGSCAAWERLPTSAGWASNRAPGSRLLILPWGSKSSQGFRLGENSDCRWTRQSRIRPEFCALGSTAFLSAVRLPSLPKSAPERHSSKPAALYMEDVA